MRTKSKNAGNSPVEAKSMGKTYGLAPECFQSLIQLLKRVEPLRSYADAVITKKERKGIPPSLTESGYKKLCSDYRQFEEKHGVRLAAAARTVIEQGWPEHTDRQVLDLYRKSVDRQNAAPPLYKNLAEHPCEKVQAKRRKQGYRLDHDLRQGRPMGPILCEKPSDELPGLAARINLMFAEGGQGFSAPDFIPKNALGLSFQELADHVSGMVMKDLTGNHIPVPDHILHFVLGAWFGQRVRAIDLKQLRSIEITVPLDCPANIRDREISKIVSSWRERRRKSGLDLEVRDSLASSRKDMNLLPRRLRILCANQEDRELPREAGFTTKGNDLWGSFITALHGYLCEEGYQIDFDVLDECAAGAKDRMRSARDDAE